jgi:hypothetical protein
VVDLANTMSMLAEPFAKSEYVCTDCDYTMDTRSVISCFAELQQSASDIQQSDTVQILGKLLSMKSVVMSRM